MGIEPTHKGFADLVLKFLSSHFSINTELVIEVLSAFCPPRISNTATTRSLREANTESTFRRGLKIENLGYPVLDVELHAPTHDLSR